MKTTAPAKIAQLAFEQVHQAGEHNKAIMSILTKTERSLAQAGLIFSLFGFQLANTQATELPEGAKSASTGAAGFSSNEAAKGSAAESTYLRDVLPIIMGRCARCHNGQGLLPNWMDYKTAFGHRAEIKRRVWDSWKGKYFKQSMPAGNSQECEAITEDERSTIKEWVLAGGVLGVHPAEHGPRSKQERIELGQKLFNNVCAACHQSTGLGIPDKFPPLAASDFLNSDKNRAIKTLLNGRQGEIVVNRHKFNNSMPSLPLADDDIANALTFVYNSFGNSGKLVTPEEVKVLRGQPDTDAPGQQKEVARATEEKSQFE